MFLFTLWNNSEKFRESCQAGGKDAAVERLERTQWPLSSPPRLSVPPQLFSSCIHSHVKALQFLAAERLFHRHSILLHFLPPSSFLNKLFQYFITFLIQCAIYLHTVVTLYDIIAPCIYLLTHFPCLSCVMWRISFFMVMVYWCSKPASVLLPLSGVKVWGWSTLFLDAF